MGPRGERSGVLAAVASVIVGGGLGVLLGAMTIQLVQDRLHINCGMGAPGSEGADTWTCADGIGYIGVAVVLGIMWFVAVVIGGLVALLVRSDRVARVCLIVLATASAGWLLGWTRYGSATLVQDEYAPLTGLGYWDQVLGPTAIAAVAGLALAVVSVILSGRVSWLLGIGAALMMVVAVVLQPGTSITLAPAAGLLAAAAARGADERGG